MIRLPPVSIRPTATASNSNAKSLFPILRILLYIASMTLDTTTLDTTRRAIVTRFALLYSHASIWIMTGVLIAAIAFITPHWTILLTVLIIAGIGGQMLTEYNIHRFIFHLPPPQNQTAFNLLYLCHYGHHDLTAQPRRYSLLPSISTPLIGGFLIYLDLHLRVFRCASNGRRLCVRWPRHDVSGVRVVSHDGPPQYSQIRS